MLMPKENFFLKKNLNYIIDHYNFNQIRYRIKEHILS